MSSLLEKAKQVLLDNDRGTYTVPSQKLYPHQWAWDSGFAVLGWLHIDKKRALEELETLLSGQWQNGLVPHILFHHPTKEYFPGPETWHNEKSSIITQPPIWAIAMRKLLENGGDADRIKTLLPRLERSHRFFWQHRDPMKCQMTIVVHPWESGRDNCPAWDDAMKRIDTRRVGEILRVDKEKVAHPEERPSDKDYKAYLAIVQSIIDHHFEMGNFAVYDPMMTSILAKAEEDLAWLTNELHYKESEAKKRKEVLLDSICRTLWNEKEGRFAFFDIWGEQYFFPEVLAAYFPIVLSIPQEIKAKLQEELEKKYLSAPFPLPTTPLSSSLHQSKCYWRGPLWVNMNWWFSHSFPSLKTRTLELLEKEGFWEYFHPETGEGLGAGQFTWSAALAIDFLSS